MWLYSDLVQALKGERLLALGSQQRDLNSASTPSSPLREKKTR